MRKEPPSPSLDSIPPSTRRNQLLHAIAEAYQAHERDRQPAAPSTEPASSAKPPGGPAEGLLQGWFDTITGRSDSRGAE